MKHYGMSLVGQYHLNAGSDICQDAHKYLDIAPGVSIGVVADGVGSEEHSEIASIAAVEACANYCLEHYNNDGSTDLMKMLTNAFWAALYAVEDKSKETGISSAGNR